MKTLLQIVTLLSLGCFLYSCQQPGAERKEVPKETSKQGEDKGPALHKNGQVHDPCDSCAKKSNDSTSTSYTIKDYVYFQPAGTKDILLCFNNDRVDYRSGRKDFMAEVTKLRTLQVNRVSYNLFFAYDLCNSGSCTHDHPEIPEKIVIDSNQFLKRYDGKIENRFTSDDLYTGDLTYGLVTIDDHQPYGKATFILVNSNDILLKEGEKVSFRVAELKVQVDGEDRLVHMAFDAKY